MATFRIAVIGGDGIGPEVIDETVRVLEKAARHDQASFDWNHLPWSSTRFKQTGEMVPDNGWDVLARHDAILFGAVGLPDVPDQIPVHSLLLPMRRKFDQYVNLRPAYLFDGVTSPLANKAPGSIDMLVYRENTEGEYAGNGGRVHRGLPEEVATETSVFTRTGVERIHRFAFELAQKRKRKHLTLVTKSNAQRHGMVLWDEIFYEVAKRYPDVQTQRILVDAVTTNMVLKPWSLDTLVASNLHADILSDLAAALTGSLGIAPTANLNPERRFPSMFEPIHGSAFDITGKGIANPVATFWTASMMLEHLGEIDVAVRLMKAVEAVTARKLLTPDLGGEATTAIITEAVCDAL